MFYSETLLSKTGPLARVWLSANIERKLSKSHILQSDIESSVHAIVDQGQALMALRLSGQLLLGVVRIYSRKARYLLDDCNEALMKIKLAFRPGNVDLPPNQSHTANPASLMLPDVLTELDLLAPVPDPALLLSPPPDYDFAGGQDPTLLDWGSSQVLPASIEQTLGGADEGLYLDGDDLGLDIGDSKPLARESSIEVGRRESVHRPIAEEMDDTMRMYENDDLELDIGEPINVNGAAAPSVSRMEDDFNPILDDDTNMGGMDDSGMGLAEDETAIQAQPRGQRDRESLSPLSSIRSSAERELEQTFHRNRDSTIYEPGEETVHQARQAKRRKILQADIDTEIHSNQIRAQQNDRSKILKPPSFLPRDPVLLALMSMQKNRGFVSNILGDGRSAGWAPELRGILSLEIVRQSADLKRKRDSGVADMDTEGEEEVEAIAQAQKEQQPQLEVNLSSELDIPIGNLNVGGDTTLNGDNNAEELLELPPALDEGIQIPTFDDEPQNNLSPRPHTRDPTEEEEEEALQPPTDDFDSTTMPLLDPADSGPVSQGTKHAVHLLRERFSSGTTESQTNTNSTPSKRAKSGVLFQELLPEATTSRTEATKMFFEILVLATKDAIKVEQMGDGDEGRLDAPIRLRAKRGLWGSWAEMDAGGEIERQEGEVPVGGVSA